jgi:hypothetical protein
VAQWGEYACGIHHNGKRVSKARKEGLVSQYTTMSVLTMKGRGLDVTRDFYERKDGSSANSLERWW